VVSELEEDAMTSEMEPLQLAPGEGLVVSNPVGAEMTFKLRGEQTNGTLTMFESEVPAGEGPPFHVHANEEEGLYVLAGDFRFRIGDDLCAASTGSFFFVPRGTPHCFQNVGERPGRLLVTFTPSGMERFFDRFAPGAPADPEAFRALGAELGMDVLGPPLAVSHPVSGAP